MSEPTLEDALEEAGEREGWDWFEHHDDPKKGDTQAKVAMERGQRIAANAARLYASDPAFRELLDFWLDSTLRRATFTAQLGLDPMQAYAFGVFREGQNSFAMAILKMVALGQKVQPEPERDRT